MVLITMSCIVVQKVVRHNTEDREIQLENPKHRKRNTSAFTGMAYAGMVIGFGMFAIGMANAPFELNVNG
ncbi:hypothetical protein D3H35_06895 [Cohnella faecalis]|uniref:Uncharacterized protein n=2 Tax=Cohnella faecalis TaxID=2315694 RepID=A0A398CZG9_9BACL|nr:hypothetical protein D3H35_06895 [Cohnella faecalis]